MTTPSTSSAERYDCLFAPTQAGQHEVIISYPRWITGEVVGTAKTHITVS